MIATYELMKVANMDESRPKTELEQAAEIIARKNKEIALLK
jgi:hypothetical protein